MREPMSASSGRFTLPVRTIFDSDVERLDETPAFLGEQKYDLASACWDSANPRCRLGRRMSRKHSRLLVTHNQSILLPGPMAI
jgi:hypothetical protein